jgi:hypothetical protein
VKALPNHVETTLADKKMLLDLESGKYFELEGTARLIWRLVSADTTVAEVVERVVEKYSIERARAERDTIKFLESLRRAGLLIVED